MAGNPPSADNLAFLRQLFPEPRPGSLELRFVYGDKNARVPTISKFLASPDEIDFDRVLRRNRDGFHTYFGPGLRMVPNGLKEAVGQLSAIWLDLDGKDFDSDIEKGKPLALTQAKRLLPRELWPSCYVDSGRGWHLYWFLSEPLDVTAPEYIDWAEGTMSGLAEALGGDHVQDVGRLLRLPGSLNVKTPEPIPCTVAYADYNRRFTPSAFKQFFRARIRSACSDDVRFGETTAPADLADLKISDEMKLLVRVGRQPGDRYKSRSEADQAVITALVNGGYEPGIIRAVFADHRWRIGDRYRERDDGYLTRSISRARAFIEANPPSRPDGSGSTAEPRVTPAPNNGKPACFSRPLSQVFRPEVREREWLIKGLIASKSYGFIAAETKMMKSFQALDLSCSVATGDLVWNHFEVPRPGRVLFVEEEDDETTLAERLRLLERGGRKLPHDSMFRYAAKPGVYIDPVANKVNAAYEALLADVEDFRPDLVVLDALNRFHDGNENDKQHMNRVLKRLHEIRKYGAALLIIHHFNKFSKEKGRRGKDRISGSAGIGAWGENSLYVMARLADGTLRIDLEGKHVPPGVTFGIRPEPVEAEGGEEGLRFVYVGDTSGAVQSDTREKVYTAVSDLHASQPESCSVVGIADHLGMKPGTARSHLEQLETDKRLRPYKAKVGGVGQAKKIYFPANCVKPGCYHG